MPIVRDTSKTAKINFINSWAVDIIRNAYYIHGSELMRLTSTYGANAFITNALSFIHSLKTPTDLIFCDTGRRLLATDELDAPR